MNCIPALGLEFPAEKAVLPDRDGLEAKSVPRAGGDVPRVDGGVPRAGGEMGEPGSRVIGSSRPWELELPVVRISPPAREGLLGKYVS